MAAVAIGGIGSRGGAPSFRAMFADGQSVPRPPRQPHAAPEPEADPIEAARVEAFTLGFEEGCRVTAEAHQVDTDALNRLVIALEQLSPVPDGTLATMLSASVVRLVKQIVGEVAIDEALLSERCRAVASFVEDSDPKSALHVNPDDIHLIPADHIAVPVVPDANMRRGSVRLDTAEGWIEDGPDVRLSRLKALLDDMEGKL